MMCHWAEYVRQYRALQQCSPERHEQAHKTNITYGWNASNQNLNYLSQVITFLCRMLCFEIREVNMQAFTQRSENSAAACKVFPSSADLAAPLNSQSLLGALL